MKVVVSGDLLLEVSGHAPVTFDRVNTDLLRYAAVDVQIGGSAANFALAAASLFDEVLVAAAVGDDSVGRFLQAGLEEERVRTRLSIKAGLRSGVSIYIRDNAASRTKGVRLLLIAEPSALPQWNRDDARALQPELIEADVLVVDGYAFRAEPRRGATLVLMADARALGLQVVYDIVPHDCFREVRLDDVRRYAESATLIVVEARTLNALAGERWNDADADEASAYRAAEVARQRFPGCAAFIRFGFGNADRTLTLSSGGEVGIHSTGYSEDEMPRGFGDRLLAAELYRLLTCSPGEAS